MRKINLNIAEVVTIKSKRMIGPVRDYLLLQGEISVAETMVRKCAITVENLPVWLGCYHFPKISTPGFNSRCRDARNFVDKQKVMRCRFMGCFIVQGKSAQ